MTNVHPMAYIEPGAQFDKSVVIEPFAVVKKDVKLGRNVIIRSHAYLAGNTEIGEGTVIWPGASIGTRSQDLKQNGDENARVIIGKNCQIREYVTINSSSVPNSKVIIGDGCLLMAYCHVAHNCTVGNQVIMSNNATLGGYVIVEDYAIIGGMTPVHQHCRIGSHAMVGGMTRIVQDVPPYTIGAGSPFKFGGLNLVGLKRRGIPLETRKILSKAFRITYRSGLKLNEAIQLIEAQLPKIPEIEHWIHFCKTSKRGLIGMHGIARKGGSDIGLEELVN